MLSSEMVADQESRSSLLPAVFSTVPGGTSNALLPERDGHGLWPIPG